MRELIHEARRQYGGSYISVFQDGTVIPWHPLSIEDYIKYGRLTALGAICPAYLEDEIFKKCVLDDKITRNIDYLWAGIVSVVVQNIMQYSGPVGIDAFNQDLDDARAQLMNANYAVIHELTELIYTAFPYKPEEVYAMDYETFIFRAAQAEKRLIKTGYLKESISLIPQEDPRQAKRMRVREDLKKRFEEERGLREKKKEVQPVHVPQIKELEGTGKWWKKSPVLEAPNKTPINFKLEQAEQETLVASGWEKVDQVIERDKMVKDARKIYKDLIEELEKKKRK